MTATRRQLLDQLGALGVVPGDTLMVHVSLRKTGPVEGGPAGLLGALDEAVGRAGTLVMIVSSVNDAWQVDKMSPAERIARLAEVPVFDPVETPSLPEIGYFAEVFRTAPGTLVTDHPDCRFAARGGGARMLLADSPWHRAYGPGGVLDRLCRIGGRVLRLGADADTATVLHLAEYLAPVDAKRQYLTWARIVPRRNDSRVLACAGAPEAPPVPGIDDLRAVEALDHEHGIADYEPEDYFAAILGAYLREGRGSSGMLGNAGAELIDAADLVAFGAAWMGENLNPA